MKRQPKMTSCYLKTFSAVFFAHRIAQLWLQTLGVQVRIGGLIFYFLNSLFFKYKMQLNGGLKC